MSPLRSALLVLCLTTLASTPSFAASIEIFGTPGIDGGAAGTDGGPALAIADSVDAVNAARAVGGEGGDDGPSPGGTSGMGGAADARALTNADGDAASTATAAGGRGGVGYGPVLPVPPGTGGAAGDAAATASASSTHGAASAVASAAGGAGGAAGISVDSSTIPYTYSSTTAGSGGSAQVSATAQGAGKVDVSASAVGGNGGRGAQPGAAGGVSVGPVSGVSTGGGAVDVRLSARGGDGGSGVAGGRNADGADVSLLQSVSGETSGSLFLQQSAFAGNAGGAEAVPAYTSALAGAGGDATSELTHAAHGTSVSAALVAVGGDGSQRTAQTSPGGASRVVGEISNDAGSVTLQGHSEGGMGGGVGAGGAATLELRATTAGDGHAISVGQGYPGGLGNGAYGGAADPLVDRFAPHDGSLGQGGDARSKSIGEALGASDVVVLDYAVGGAGGTVAGPTAVPGSDGGTGGDAWSTATATTHGGASAAAYSFAVGGNGGDGGNNGAGGGSFHGGAGGTAHASAHGESDFGDVVVYVEQRGGAGGAGPVAASEGASSVLRDAATGETLGDLSLTQRAVGGASHSGVGGDAESSLAVDRADGGSLAIDAYALGGDGQAPSLDGRTGGDALVTVDARARNGSSVDINGLAIGGSDGYGSGGNAVLDLTGASDGGGAVTIRGEVRAGGGERGGAAELYNAVTGRTSGLLHLEQIARGGYGTFTGGAATSVMDLTGAAAVSASRVEVETSAYGGGGGAARNAPLPTDPETRGDAQARTAVHNDSGSVTASARAFAGAATTTANPAYEGAVGSNASAEAEAGTEGDGHSALASALAAGGDGQAGLRIGVNGSRGGDAVASSHAFALGDSPVASQAVAGGGSGGSDNSADLGGPGGDARATASAIGAGTSSVSALAQAYGGSPGISNVALQNDWGRASASASAYGLGEVRSRSETWGGTALEARAVAQLGDAMTLDVSRGSTAHQGQGGYRIFGTVDASLSAELTHDDALEQVAGVYGQLTLATGLPDPTSARTWVDGHPNVAAALGDDGEVLGIGLVSSASFVASSSSRMDFRLPPGAVREGDSLHIGFLDTLSGGDFDSLEVRVDVQVLDAAQILSLSFDEAADATATLGDFVLAVPTSLGDAAEVGALVSVAIDVAMPNIYGLQTTTDFVLFATRAVPEPGDLAALAALAVLLTWIRRSRTAP